MFRLRRYRVFLAFAAVSVLALYRFGNPNASWRDHAASQSAQRQQAEAEPQVKWEPKPAVAKETKKFQVEVPAAKRPQIKQTPPPIAPVPRPLDETRLVDEDATMAQGKKSITVGFGHVGAGNAVRPNATPTPRVGEGQAVLVDQLSSSEGAIHWSKPKEQFPIPTESLIALPTAKPKAIPRIQADFNQESAAEKADREMKLVTIKDVFKSSWAAYKEFAWLHDEVMPVSGGYKDPFAGWGATLVDALDTLWIMGLEEEFEEAVKAVNEIDFTTTSRPDIPLFETTIRYMGGFLAAYDIAGKKHQVLLTKATELAEILLAAFDTPNRMPQTYYYWRPDFSSNTHPAGNRAVLAEIGSLSMEFTYLAQLTGEHKYYDAVARITDNLEGFQNHTRLPGMWPTYLDASGCAKPNYNIDASKPLQKPLSAGDPGWEESLKNGAYLKADPNLPLVKPAVEGSTHTVGEELSPEGKKYIPLDKPEPLKVIPNGPNPAWKPPPEEPLVWPGPTNNALKKRQLADAESPSVVEQKPKCDNPGFRPSSDGGKEEYTLGGMSDSTYEYLPKEWLLLGNQVDKYRTMYERSADVVKKHILFRPMVPNDDDILFSGKLYVPVQEPGEPFESELESENAHLTCFAGGMFGMGAKIFNRPKDLEIAVKLTQGCVWAYNMTATGIMPEAFDAVACESRRECHWNETRYYELLDPNHENRMTQYQEAMANYDIRLKSASLWYDEQMQQYTGTPTPAPSGTGIAVSQAEATAAADSVLDKRQLADFDDSAPARNGSIIVGNVPEDIEEPPSKVQSEPEEPSPSKTMPTFPVIYSPQAPLDHKEYVQNRIQESRLPPGVTRIKSYYYILRPEAIESVWYMYRITGDKYWREVGWRMFEAIIEHTKAAHGYSAIDDVTKKSPSLNDSMESFWLAETLKYFYLLFSEPGVVSLDEWVLNTEAHPFRRPA